MLSALLAAFAGTLAAQLSPGPNLLAVAGVALGQGRRPAIAVAAGVATGATAWGLAFALGVSALFEAHPSLGVALQFLGGGYFLYVGLRALRSAWRGAPAAVRASAAAPSLGAAFRRGLLVVLTNPKAALMWASVTAFLAGAGVPPLGVVLFAPLGGLSALAIYGGYGALFSTPAAQAFHARTARGFEAAFGALFGALGVRLVVDGVRELRA